MTYCLAINVDEGLVFCSDSRTNAGVDNVSVYSKMRTFCSGRPDVRPAVRGQSCHHPGRGEKDQRRHGVVVGRLECAGVDARALQPAVGRVAGVPVKMLNKQKKLVDAVGYPTKPGMVSTSPTTAMYPWLERYGLRPEAKRLGIPEASYQAAGWQSQDSRPILTILNELIEEGSRARGLAPNRFFDELARGNAIFGPGAGTFR